MVTKSKNVEAGGGAKAQGAKKRGKATKEPWATLINQGGPFTNCERIRPAITE